ATGVLDARHAAAHNDEPAFQTDDVLDDDLDGGVGDEDQRLVQRGRKAPQQGDPGRALHAPAPSESSAAQPRPGPQGRAPRSRQTTIVRMAAACRDFLTGIPVYVSRHGTEEPAKRQARVLQPTGFRVRSTGTAPRIHATHRETASWESTNH